jgi:hypothetical protein
MKDRWKILIIVGIFLAVFFCIWLITMHVQPANEVEAYKNSLRARGEKLEISEVLPPAIAPESNGVMFVQSAFGLFTTAGMDQTNLPTTMRMVAPGKAMVGWAQPTVRGNDFTNSWENVIAAAQDDQPAIDLLQQAANYPAIDFQLDYKKGPDLMLPNLAPMKRSAQRLSAVAMCDLHNGDAGSAATNLCVLLALVHGMQNEEIIISQLVRFAMASITAGATWELLQSTNVTDTELAILQKNWERLEYIQPTENAFLMERAIIEFTVQKMRASAADFNHFSGMYSLSGMSSSSSSTSSGDWLDNFKNYWNDTKLAGATFMWRTSWTYSDERNALQGDQIILEAIRTIKTNQFFLPVYTNMTSQLSAMGITNAGEDWITKLDIPDFRRIFSEYFGALSSTVHRTMAAETTKRVVITAIALKRFQLKHGNFPEKLSELAPEFLSSVPLDPIDGKPLRYRKNSDGTFLLYSVGDNGVDDGGNPTVPPGITGSVFYWQNYHARDWVWPQPATPAEVQYFYDHPPK